jgi:hypothetical protein
VDTTSDTFLICDFGFADFVAEAERQLVAGLKHRSTQGMTLRYAAPEVSTCIFQHHYRYPMKFLYSQM